MWRWGILSLVSVLLLAIGWVGIRGLLARSELEAAVPLAARIQQQMSVGDAAAAAATFVVLQKHSAAAASLTSDPIWRAAEVVPFAGINLAVVRQLTEVVNEVTSQAIRPLTELVGTIQLDDFKPVDGTVAMQPLIDAAPIVHTAAAALVDARTRADAIDASSTIGLVHNAADRLVKVVTDASNAVTSVDNAVALLPAMLGADGPRNYLLLFQNPAELRSGGGIPGALALMHTEGGHLSLVQQVSASDFPQYNPPVLELPMETRGLYGDITGQYMQDVTLTPQFPLAAALAREMWKRQFGVEVDGVLSADPVMLGYLLEATGPVDVGGGAQLTAGNAVKLLLSDTYARPPRDQDAFFAAAASAVFSKIAGGHLDARKLVEALARAGQENRILVWSAHDADQAILAGTTLAGGLPVSDSRSQRFGVYLNDGTGAKMDYYLDTQVAIGQAVCRNDGRATVTLEVTLTSTAPVDAATALPRYVTGGGAFGVPPGSVRTIVTVYGPSGTINVAATADSGQLSVHTSSDSGHSVTQFQVELVPGQSQTVRVEMLAAANAPPPNLAVARTPGISSPLTRTLSPSC